MTTHFAFPSNSPENLIGGTESYPGMELCDYFAAKAMAALLIKNETKNLSAVELYDLIAFPAYQIAALMLKASNHTHV